MDDLIKAMKGFVGSQNEEMCKLLLIFVEELNERKLAKSISGEILVKVTESAQAILKKNDGINADNLLKYEIFGKENNTEGQKAFFVVFDSYKTFEAQCLTITITNNKGRVYTLEKCYEDKSFLVERGKDFRSIIDAISENSTLDDIWARIRNYEACCGEKCDNISM